MQPVGFGNTRIFCNGSAGLVVFWVLSAIEFSIYAPPPKKKETQGFLTNYAQKSPWALSREGAYTEELI